MSVSERIGPYDILCRLGEGGMGVVYRSVQPSVNRVVALKVLPEDLEADERAVQRFREEAVTAANLAHDNIVKVWDASVDAPPYYIAMQFVEGGTLADRLAKGPLGVEQAIAVIASVCDALDYAHQRGVVHRDIKPANIMFDASGKALVTDFGIARVADWTRMTITGARLGTPDYMSPEQVKGGGVGPRSDLYSAVVVLYEMLTGRPPFTGDPLTVMHQTANEEPPSPSAFRPDIPQALESVLLRGLAKDPGDRYQTGKDLVNAIQAAARVPERIARATQPHRKRPTPRAAESGARQAEGVGAYTCGPGASVPASAHRRLTARTGLLLGLLAATGALMAVTATHVVRRQGAEPIPQPPRHATSTAGPAATRDKTRRLPTTAPGVPEAAGTYLIQSDGTALRWLTNGAAPEWSPDGRHILFERDDDLWLTDADGGHPERLMAGAGSGRWSPSGDQIAFVSGHPEELSVHVMRLADKLHRELCDGYDPAWTPDGQKMVCAYGEASRGFGLRVVDVGNGRYRNVLGPYGGEDGALGIYEPLPSRDGRHVYFRRIGEDLATISVVDLATRVVEEFAETPGYASSGPDSAGSQGRDGGDPWSYYGVAQCCLAESPRGEHWAFNEWIADWAQVGIPERIVITSPEGKREAVFEGASATWSPDGTRLAYERRLHDPSGSVICVISADGKRNAQLVPGKNPRWAPTGETIAFEYGERG
jgi:Tol biopolymer transport system component